MKLQKGDSLNILKQKQRFEKADPPLAEDKPSTPD